MQARNKRKQLAGNVTVKIFIELIVGSYGTSVTFDIEMPIELQELSYLSPVGNRFAEKKMNIPHM